jgi:hypothetical protein
MRCPRVKDSKQAYSTSHVKRKLYRNGGHVTKCIRSSSRPSSHQQTAHCIDDTCRMADAFLPNILTQLPTILSPIKRLKCFKYLRATLMASIYTESHIFKDRKHRQHSTCPRQLPQLPSVVILNKKWLRNFRIHTAMKISELVFSPEDWGSIYRVTNLKGKKFRMSCLGFTPPPPPRSPGDQSSVWSLSEQWDILKKKVFKA